MEEFSLEERFATDVADIFIYIHTDILVYPLQFVNNILPSQSYKMDFQTL